MRVPAWAYTPVAYEHCGELMMTHVEQVSVDHFKVTHDRVVSDVTRQHERRVAAEHRSRVLHLISPRDRAFGLGKWSQKVAHNTARAVY